MAIFEVDATGVHVPSLEEAQANVLAQLSAIFGDDLARASQTPQAQLAGVIAILEAIVGEALVRLGNAQDPDKAVGTQLDTIGSLLDILRDQATRSRVTATVTGVPGTNLPALSRAKTTAEAEFRTTTSVTLAPQPGVTVDMEAVDFGPVEAAAGTLTEIVTVIPGWETITNVSAAVVGVSRQGDPAYRTARRTRTAHRSLGPMSALEAAVDEALGGKSRVAENATTAAVVLQEWSINPHSILVVAQSGTDGDIRRAIETHRGMGVGTMVGIVGGTPDNSALDAVNNGTVNWNGTDYTGLDLTTSTDDAAKATTLTTLLDGTGVTVRAIDGIYIAMFGWQPAVTPMFGTGTVITDFGLAPAVSDYPTGPFVRPRERTLTVMMAVTQGAGFPADGLALLRASALRVASGYQIGQQAWSNDFLQAAEAVTGTRITAITVQHNGTAVSGVDIPLDALYVLPTANISIVIT